MFFIREWAGLLHHLNQNSVVVSSSCSIAVCTLNGKPIILSPRLLDLTASAQAWLQTVPLRANYCEVASSQWDASGLSVRMHMGGCRNYDPFLGTLNIRCRIIIGIQKRTIILTTTHIQNLNLGGLGFRVRP